MIKIDSDQTEPDVRIELIPLIDVIFCILTFFILAAVTLTRQAALNVDLPSAKTGTTQMRQLLVVSVDPIGQTYVEKLPVTTSQLREAAVKFHQENPQGTVVLYASRASSYNDVIQVLDLLKSVDGVRVALATLPNNSPDGQLPGLTPNGGQLTPISPSTLPGLTNPSALPGQNTVPGTGLNQPNTLPGTGLNQNTLPGTGLPNRPSNSLNSPNLPSSTSPVQPTLPGLNAPPATQPGNSLPPGARPDTTGGGQ
jgi:biopolymer transport protein ExbD